MYSLELTRFHIYHRPIQVGRYLVRFLVQLPAERRVNTASDRFAQGFVHLGFENTEGQRPHSFSEQPLPMLKYPQNEHFSLYPVSISSFNLCPLYHHGP